MRHWFLLIANVFAALGLGACGGPDAAATTVGVPGRLSGKLTLTGSSTIAPLASEIARRFEASHPDVRVDVQTGGSSRGIADARDGRAEIGMSSRALRPEEAGGLLSDTIAWDGVAFVVHADNPVAELTDEQLVAVFTGRIDNWRQLGGPDAAIVVVNRADGRSELDLVTAYLGLEATDIRAGVIGGENQQVVKTVAANPHAISYLSVGTSEVEIARGTRLKLLPLAGVAASSETVQGGGFPLARPLLMVVKTGGDELTATFLEYARSDAVHDLVRAQSFVPAG